MRRALVRALPLALLSAAFVFDFVACLTMEKVLFVAAWSFLVLGLGAGHVAVTVELIHFVQGTRQRRLGRAAIVYPLVQGGSLGLAFLALLLHPLLSIDLPTASMALTVVSVGSWLMIEQFRGALLAPVQPVKTKQPGRRLRLVISRRSGAEGSG